MKILIRLPNWIGDAVMALPAILALGETRPDWEWSLLGGPRVRPLFEGLDEPFRLLEAGSDRPSAARFLREAWALRRERFDAALLLPPSFRAALQARVAGARERAGWASDGRGRLLTLRAPAPVRTRPLREQYADLAASLLDRLSGEELRRPASGEWTARRAPLRAEEIERARAFLRGARIDPGRAVALAPGASYGPTKRWPEERFAELARRLCAGGSTPLWIGGPAERDLCASLAASAGGLPLAGDLALREALAVLALLRGAVSNDSGAMHLAQAAGCPVVGIFGSTAPEWTGPAGASAVVREPVPCAPCFAPTCPTEFECLRGISVDRVEAALNELLVRSAAARGRPAVFLDRDGTVIEEVNYLTRPEQVRLLPGAAGALRALAGRDFALVVITNQSAVARGLLDRAGLHGIHLRLRSLLEAEGLRLEGIEFCPHLPEITGPCACRKPAPGMLERAAHRFDLDLARSFLVGDTPEDLEAGRRAGCRSVLVRTGHGMESVRRLEEAGDQRAAVFAGLAEAADWILSEAAKESS